MLPNNKKSIKNLYPDITIDGIKISDFWRAWQLTSEFLDNSDNYDYLIIQETDRWDTIAEQVYNDRQLWWTLPLMNSVEDPFSIYFNKNVPQGITKIKYLKASAVGLLLNKIREKRLQFEKES